MLSKIKSLIDEHGMDYWKSNIVETTDPHKYVRSYHKHSFILTENEVKQCSKTKSNKPDIIINDDYMKITLTGLEEGEPVSIDGINNIVIDLRNHRGGYMYHGIKIMQNIYGNTTMYKSCNKWYSLQDGKLIFDKLGDELSFKGNIVVLVSEKTASSGEILALTFMGRKNTTILGCKTGGYLSMNGFFKIDDKHTLNLTISRFSDVTDKEYVDECITPRLNID